MRKILLFFFWIQLVYWMTNGSLRAQEIEEKPVNATPIVKEERACFGNFGSLHPTLNLADQSIRDKKRLNGDIPSLDLSSNIAFQFGCQFGFWIVDYTISDDSFLFQKEILIKGVQYNSLLIHQEIISLGFNYAIMEGLIGSEFGLSYTQYSYELGYYDGESSTDRTDSEENSTLLMVHLTLSYTFRKTHSLRWRYQKSLDSSSLIDSNNQFSLNFLVPF
ncbi:MAG: hypothetical protein GY786_11645 [Proteobacteria bacterium]|nr:hypothetical protein [Pseudomonadota bacterium]